MLPRISSPDIGRRVVHLRAGGALLLIMSLVLKHRTHTATIPPFSATVRFLLVCHPYRVIARRAHSDNEMSSEAQQSTLPLHHPRTTDDIAHRLLNTATEYLKDAPTASPLVDARYRAKIADILEHENGTRSWNQLIHKLDRDCGALKNKYAYLPHRSHGACLAIIIMSTCPTKKSHSGIFTKAILFPRRRRGLLTRLRYCRINSLTCSDH
jgi:hypothetical protein